MGVLEKIKQIEEEMARTQKNKGPFTFLTPSVACHTRSADALAVPS